MGSLKKETDPTLQRLSAQAIGHLVHQCRESKANVVDKLVKNICTQLGKDAEQVPQIAKCGQGQGIYTVQLFVDIF